MKTSGAAGSKAFNAGSKALRKRMICDISGAAAAAAVTVTDQVIKARVEREHDGNLPRELTGSVSIDRLHNDGLPMGILADCPAAVTALPAAAEAAAAARFFMIGRKTHAELERTGLLLMLGGGLSNLIDRFRYGYVVDYISVRKGILKKIVFNLGDLAVFAGGILAGAGFALRFFLERRHVRFSARRKGAPR